MGKVIQRPVIIELNGCCGCGKSTLFAVFEKVLKTNQIRYITKERLLEQYSLSYSFKFLMLYRIILWKLFCYLISLNPFRLERFKYFKYVLSLKYAIDCAKNNDRFDAILLDEGIIQGIYSISYLDSIKKRNVTRSLLNVILNNTDFLVVNCQIDLKELPKRIQKRNRKVNDRFDKYDSIKEMKKKLYLQNKNLIKIRTMLPDTVNQIDIDTGKTVEKNAQKIYMMLKNMN